MNVTPAFRVFGIGRVKVRPDLARDSSGSRARLILVGYRTVTPRLSHTASQHLAVTFAASGVLAETIAAQIQAGDRLFIEGHLEPDRWTDRVTGHRRVGVAFVLDEFYLLERAPNVTRPEGASVGQVAS